MKEQYKVWYINLNVSTVEPSHLAISVVLDPYPPSNITPSSTSQEVWPDLSYRSLWLFFQPELVKL